MLRVGMHAVIALCLAASRDDYPMTGVEIAASLLGAGNLGG